LHAAIRIASPDDVHVIGPTQTPGFEDLAFEIVETAPAHLQSAKIGTEDKTRAVNIIILILNFPHKDYPSLIVSYLQHSTTGPTEGIERF